MKVGASVFCVFFACLLSLPLTAAIINVPGDQPTIQAGIDAAADGDTVLVADGTYTGEGNRDIDFLGKAITVRSENGAEGCIIDCEELGRGFNFHSAEDQDSVLQGFTIPNGDGTLFNNRGGGIYCNSSSPTITNCTFNGNLAIFGSGISCVNSSPTITNCTFKGNVAAFGGGIFCDPSSSPTITNCTFSENDADAGNGDGGGIFCDPYSSPTITNCTFNRNVANYGGGIYCDISSPTITNCTFSGNIAAYGGAGICFDSSSLTFTNCTFNGNVAAFGGGIFCVNSSPTITNCIVWDNFPDAILTLNSGAPMVTYSDIEGGWSGEGNIDADPLFVIGPHGECHLSNAVCGDPETSPCVDAGDPTTVVYGSTGCLFDLGIVDMGCHYPAMGLVVGPGPAPDNPPDVRTFPPEQDAEYASEFSAYGAPHYGVNVSCGNVDGDGSDSILTGAGPGDIYGPHVRGFAVDGTPLPGLSYLAYGSNKWGVNVAAGDIDADGFDEIITGAGPGAVFGPHVRGWDWDGGPEVTPISGVSYFAYGTPKWGVNVATGDIDGDGYDEIVTGAGPGAVYGPHVRGWNVDNGLATAMSGVSFLAYGTNHMGVNVTCGDVDGDGIDEIVTGPGPSGYFGAHIRGWNYDGSLLAPLAGFSFLAWSEFQFGATVFAGADLNSDGRDELVVGGGPDPDAGTEVKVFEYDGSEVTLWFSLEAFPGVAQGAHVAAGRF